MGPLPPPSRALIVGHPSAIAEGIRWLTEAAQAPPEIDALPYGRAAADLPLPTRVRRVRVPEPAGAAGMLRLFLALRRRRYDVALVVQPGLWTSRARGALLGLAAAIGARRIVAWDPGAARPACDVGRASALADLGRFIAFTGLSTACAVAAARAVGVAERIAPESPPAREPPPQGRVVYLRTDVDLAVQPLTAGGSLAHTDGILEALARRGHEVEVWSTGRIAGAAEALPGRRLPACIAPNVPREMSELAAGLAQYARRRASARPAFVYQRYSLNNLAGLLLARRWEVPLVLEANASEAEWREDWSALQFGALARATERLLVRRADRVAAVSENAAAQLRRSGAADGRLRVVPNGVDVARFDGVDPMPLPFDGTPFVVMFTGLFYPWHGVRFLAEAFPMLLRTRPGARLVLVGDGEDAPLARSTLERGAALDAALMTGLVPREDVPRWLAAADVVVSPHARNDDFIGSPIKVWEYMASGRAIVASRVAQIGSVLRDGETALLVEPDDPAAISAALVRLHDDADLRARLGDRARDEARRLHSWDARLAATLRDA